MPRRRQVRQAKKEEVIDPQVVEMFDTVWEIFLKIAEEEVVYNDVSAPLTTRKVLEKVENMLRQDFDDSLYEEFLVRDIDFHVALTTGYFADYVVWGELPSREDLETYIGMYMEACHERETLDEFVACVNTYYDYFLRLVKFFDALPKLLEVKVVEGEITPDLCSDKVTSEEIVANTIWYVGLRTSGTYGELPIHLNYYGVRDGRVMVTGVGLRGSWCSEDFAEKEVPRLVDRLRELRGRPDLVVHVYGEPPINLKSISPSLIVRRLEAPPEP
jgi:hypothetical protein